MNKIKLLKFTDQMIGRPFVFLLSKIKKNYREYPVKIKKILLIRPGGIGDAVLLSPVINALRLRFPKSNIDVLCEKRNADIFRLSKEINRIYLYDMVFGIFKCLRNEYDVVIDTEQWHRLSAAVVCLTGAAVRIGFDTNERGKLFTHRIPYSHDDYEVYSFLRLIEPFKHCLPPFVQFNPEESFLDINEELPIQDAGCKIQDLEKIVIKHNYSSKGLIAISPGGSVVEKRWRRDRFEKVAKELSDKGYKIVIVGSNADREDADRIKKHATDSIDLTGRTSLIDVAKVFKLSKLLITADSGLMHIAYAVGTPTVSIFGASSEKKWAPRGKQHIVLNKHLECSPCSKFGYIPRCKKDVKCLSSISINEVISATKHNLAT